jgi:hypothetical protein
MFKVGRLGLVGGSLLISFAANSTRRLTLDVVSRESAATFPGE